MAEPRRLTLADLRSIVADSSELAKGTHIHDEKGLAHLARFELKLYADAAGSGAAPYKVQVTIDEKVTARCSCMAARSRPFCKHAAALLVAWSRAPEGFAVSDTAPAGVGGERKKKEVKKGSADGATLMKQGVEQVSTLVRELSVAGVASMAADRAEQVRQLADNLRENKLRRLSARTLELADLLAQASQKNSTLDPMELSGLLADMLLTARKLEKHLAGEALDDRYVEELIGKTWTRKDRKPVEGLDLVEYAFLAHETADGFVIRESRLLDVKTGEHFSEKQIIPGFLARRTEPKPSHMGHVLQGARGSVYPSFSPLRVDLEERGDVGTLDSASVKLLLARCLPDVGTALKAFQERRKDVFAPDQLPVAVRVDTVFAQGARLRVVDAQDAALFLPDEAVMQERLAQALRHGKLRAVLGDIGLDGALPTLFPLAVVVEEPAGFRMLPLGMGPIAGTQKVRLNQAATPVDTSGWARVAREVGASAAAVSLGELREEMAHAWVMGLSALSSRFTDPLVARLKELGLEKQADLLATLPGRPDAADRLDDYTKVFQLLGIALTRLTGASHVDRTTLHPVPTYESVQVTAPSRVLPPSDVAAAVSLGTLNRYEAALHYARHYESVPAAQLAESIFPTWADGSAAPFVARAFAGKGRVAVDAAERALSMAHGRVAWFTALAVLEAQRSSDAERALGTAASKHQDTVVRRRAARALDSLKGRATSSAQALAALCNKLMTAPNKEDRQQALLELTNLGDPDAIPWVRLSFSGDISLDVREEAAMTLGRLGDVESVDAFVRLMAERRNVGGIPAKGAAYALGCLGDVRGLHALLDAYAEGWQPGVVTSAIREMGQGALLPLLRFVEEHPELASRKAAQGVVAGLEPEEVFRAVSERLQGAGDAFVPAATTLFTLCQGSDAMEQRVAREVLRLRPSLGEKGASDEEKSLRRRVKRAAG